MPIEVAKTISVDARNTLVRNRDSLQTRHGIQIFFPRNRVRGDTQDMILKGGPNAIARAEREIDTILVAWFDEYTAFKQRQAYRKQNRRRLNADNTPPKFPSLPTTTSTNTKPTHKNAFAALDSLAQPSPDTTHENVAQVPVTNPKKPALTGWAAMAAKPAEKPAEKPPSKPTKFTFGTTGSGAAFTYDADSYPALEPMPEPEHFDWAEDAEQQSPGGWDTW